MGQLAGPVSFQSYVRDVHPPYRRDRYGGPLLLPNLLVMHETDGKTAASAMSWQNRMPLTGAKSSYHYLIDDPDEPGGHRAIFRGVPVDCIAYHAGLSAWPLPPDPKTIRGSLNGRSLGVAWCCYSSEGDRVSAWQLDAGVWLAAVLCRRFGIPVAGIRGHNEIAPHRRRDPVTVDMRDFRDRVSRELHPFRRG